MPDNPTEAGRTEDRQKEAADGQTTDNLTNTTTKNHLYHLDVLRLMLNELDPVVAIPLAEQLNKYVEDLKVTVRSYVYMFTAMEKEFENQKSQIADIQTQLTYMQFDLEATRRERDMYKGMLDNI